MKPAWGWGRIATVEKAGKDLEIRVGVAVGMEEMGALLGRWRMDEAEMRRRRWPMHWNGMPIRLAYGPGHSRRAAPRRWFLNRVVVPPPCWTWSTGRVEGGGAGVSIASRNRPIQPELEGGATLLLCHRFGFAIFSRDSSD